MESAKEPRCKNCKHWKPDWKQGWCYVVDVIEDKNDEIKDTDFAVFVRVSDEVMWSWGLKTGPNFGCVLYTAR